MEKDLSTPMLDAAREAHRKFQAEMAAQPPLSTTDTGKAGIDLPPSVPDKD